MGIHRQLKKFNKKNSPGQISLNYEKGIANRDEKASVRVAAEKSVSQFQANANDELRCEEAAIEGIKNPHLGSSSDGNHKY